MTDFVRFPEMRLDVISALRALSDPGQQSSWGRAEEGVPYYNDLTLNVHVLYDDCQVLPDPSERVGTVLLEGEVAALRGVHEALNPLLDELREEPDAEYLADRRWPTVMSASAEALRVMEALGR